METEKCLKNPSVIILGFSLDVIGMVLTPSVPLAITGATLLGDDSAEV